MLSRALRFPKPPAFLAIVLPFFEFPPTRASAQKEKYKIKNLISEMFPAEQSFRRDSQKAHLDFQKFSYRILLLKAQRSKEAPSPYLRIIRLTLTCLDRLMPEILNQEFWTWLYRLYRYLNRGKETAQENKQLALSRTL